MMRILAAIDFSPVTDDILRAAERLAGALDGKVTLVHVAAPRPDFVGYEVGPAQVRDARAHELRKEHRDIQKMAEDISSRGVEADALLIEGPTVETILREAGEINAEMIVLGTHSHGAVYEAIIGSTTSGVVHGANCPVVVVPNV